jgi:hypothetical protein
MLASRQSREGSVMDLALHRVSDPRFMAVDMPVEPAGTRRLVCPADMSLEELRALQILETGQRSRILAAFETEAGWRTASRTTSEPVVRFGPGPRGDIQARADVSWRPSTARADAAVVHALLDASGADETCMRWWLGDDACTFLYLVTPPETARHLPKHLQHAGQTVEVRVFPWTRHAVNNRFDPLAIDVWFQLAGPTMALRGPVKAMEPIRFRSR